MVLASYAPIYNLIIFLKYPLALISYYAFYYNKSQIFARWRKYQL